MQLQCRAVRSITGKRIGVFQQGGQDDCTSPSQWGDSPCDSSVVHLSYEESSALIMEQPPAADSCSEGSIIYRISSMLKSSALSDELEAIEAVRGSSSGSRWSRSQPYVYLLAAGLLVFVLLAITVLVCWSRAASARGHGGPATAVEDSQQARATGLVPKVRMWALFATPPALFATPHHRSMYTPSA